MTTRLDDNTLARVTNHKIGERAIIVTLTPGGITLHAKGTQRKLKIDYLALWFDLDAAERRGGQSDITIKARRGK